jgi:hypothetical protein
MHDQRRVPRPRDGIAQSGVSREILTARQFGVSTGSRVEMATRIPLILASAPDLHISNSNTRLHRERVAGRTGAFVSSVDTAQDLIDVFSEQYRELDSARDGTTEEVPFRLTPSRI